MKEKETAHDDRDRGVKVAIPSTNVKNTKNSAMCAAIAGL